jgi:magnesium-transporting ATPase (P-type)
MNRLQRKPTSDSTFSGLEWAETRWVQNLAALPKGRYLVEEKLSRIPFTREEELTISSMARWMRFMAVVGIVAGILMLFFVVLGVGLFSAARGLGQASPKWTELDKFFNQAGAWLYVLLAAFLLAAVVSLWQNFALYHAGDYFHLVAGTDVADLDYLSRGLDKLRTFFKIQVLVAVITVVVAFGTALVLLAVTHHVS